MSKKKYEKPNLKHHGNIKEITFGGGPGSGESTGFAKKESL